MLSYPGALSITCILINRIHAKYRAFIRFSCHYFYCHQSLSFQLSDKLEIQQVFIY